VTGNIGKGRLEQKARERKEAERLVIGRVTSRIKGGPGLNHDMLSSMTPGHAKRYSLQHPRNYRVKRHATERRERAERNQGANQALIKWK